MIECRSAIQMTLSGIDIFPDAKLAIEDVMAFGTN